MIYVLLDTNIIIDMVVDRRDMVKDKILADFVRLIEFDEVKLIVPEIIKTETFRHLDEELSNVGKKIERTLDNIKGLYGVATLNTTPLDLGEYKKRARAELNEALKIYESNKSLYRSDIFDTVNLLFTHKNTIVIEDISLMDVVLKRKIYKRAPFHKVEKESNGDGVITETLINIEKFIELASDDIIYFVTGNYTDFSSSKDKNILHEDILSDLAQSGVEKYVRYVRSFNCLVRKDLKDSVKNAKSLEELQRDLEAEEENYQRQFEEEMVDLERESFGFSSLSSFESQVEEQLSISTFAESMTELYGEFKSIENEIEDIILKYEDLADDLRNMDLVLLPDALQKLSDTCDLYCEVNYSGVKELLDYLDDRVKSLENLVVCEDFECLNFGSSYSIYLPDQCEFILEIEDLYLSPSSGESDEIDILLYSTDSFEYRFTAQIDICYGEIEVDDDGGIANAYEESVSLSDYGIVKQIYEIIDIWKKYISDEQKFCNELCEKIEDGNEEINSSI